MTFTGGHYKTVGEAAQEVCGDYVDGIGEVWHVRLGDQPGFVTLETEAYPGAVTSRRYFEITDAIQAGMLTRRES